ncbi:MAG: aminotransferase class I/II-fold pyridoxal phosphate-dependent enzyme, partial [Pseudomonadales bacterium]
MKPFSGNPRYHFVGGNIDEQTIPTEALANAVGDVIRNHGSAMGKYGMNSGPQGHLPLREFISDNLKRCAGMSVTPDEVLVTTGSLQAMDLVNKALLNKGDVVLVEAANYSGTLTKLDALGVDYIGIDLDEKGMC